MNKIRIFYFLTLNEMLPKGKFIMNFSFLLSSISVVCVPKRNKSIRHTQRRKKQKQNKKTYAYIVIECNRIFETLVIPHRCKKRLNKYPPSVFYMLKIKKENKNKFQAKILTSSFPHY